MSGVIPNYTTPQEAIMAAADETDKALGAVIAMLGALYFEMRDVRYQIADAVDDEEIAGLEYHMKNLRREEASLHRIMSGLQSRLKAGR